MFRHVSKRDDNVVLDVFRLSSFITESNSQDIDGLYVYAMRKHRDKTFLADPSAEHVLDWGLTPQVLSVCFCVLIVSNVGARSEGRVYLFSLLHGGEDDYSAAPCLIEFRGRVQDR